MRNIACLVIALASAALAGTFAGALARQTALAPGAMYGCRIRQQSTAGTWSDWSRWHQAFITDKE